MIVAILCHVSFSTVAPRPLFTDTGLGMRACASIRLVSRFEEQQLVHITAKPRNDKLDSCVRNIGLVQNMAVLSPKELCTEAIEGSSFRSARQQVEQSDEKVVCPMPRKIATVSFVKGESVKPFWQRRGLLPSTLDGEANHEILEIFRSKTSCGNATSFGCSPPYFSGSPPCRAGNPMVQDVEFFHQRRLPLPASIMQSNPVVQDVEFSQKRLSSPLPAKSMQPRLAATTATFRSSPCVRVEGFDCPGRGFECTSRDTRRHVPAFA